jgi:hypothetical protein
MTRCDHYWRDGIVLVEHGDPDPHRDTCVQCRREHRAREQLIQALPMVGDGSGDPGWQEKVWLRVARLESPRAVRQPRFAAAGLAISCGLALACWMLVRREPLADTRPRIEIVAEEVTQRSRSSRVGDRIRLTVTPADEARIYRADQLVLRCRAGSTELGCTSDARGIVAEAVIAAEGDYELVVITTATAEPVGRLDLDLQAITSAGGEYQISELSVR